MKHNFIDTAEIFLQGGKGGNGSMSFHRAMYVPKGGPSGGNGGKGGNIYLESDENMSTLLDLKFQKLILGNAGSNGSNKVKHGRNGLDKFIKVPLGTKIINRDTNKCVGDITKISQRILIVKGGKGGRGNKSFASSANKAPTLFENGSSGGQMNVALELQVLADVGLVGLPNAGKSTLLSVISNSTPKIANYPFTTLHPHLGVVGAAPGQSFVCADLPGLIAGASDGKGLGHLFLKHISRCLVIAHVIDVSGGQEADNLIKNFNQIMHELKTYNPTFLEKKMMVIANKMDDEFANQNLKYLKDYLNGKYQIVPISALMHDNLKILKYKLFATLQIAKQATKQAKTIMESQPQTKIYQYRDPSLEFKVVKKGAHTYEVSGAAIRSLVEKINLSTHDNYVRFNQILKKMGVFNVLIEKRIQENDIIKLYDVELSWK